MEREDDIDFYLQQQWKTNSERNREHLIEFWQLPKELSGVTYQDDNGTSCPITFVNMNHIRLVDTVIGRHTQFQAAFSILCHYVLGRGIIFFRGLGALMRDSVSRHLEDMFQDLGKSVVRDWHLFGYSLVTRSQDPLVMYALEHVSPTDVYVGFVRGLLGKRVFFVFDRTGQPRRDIQVIPRHESDLDLHGRITTPMSALLEVCERERMAHNALHLSTVSSLFPALAVQTRPSAPPPPADEDVTKRVSELVGGNFDAWYLNSGRASLLARRPEDNGGQDRLPRRMVVSSDADNIAVIEDMGRDKDITVRGNVDPASCRLLLRVPEEQQVTPLPGATPPQFYERVTEEMTNSIARVIGLPVQMWVGGNSRLKGDAEASDRVGQATISALADELQQLFNHLSKFTWGTLDGVSDTIEPEGKVIVGRASRTEQPREERAPRKRPREAPTDGEAKRPREAPTDEEARKPKLKAPKTPKGKRAKVQTKRKGATDRKPEAPSEETDEPETPEVSSDTPGDVGSRKLLSAVFGGHSYCDLNIKIILTHNAEKQLDRQSDYLTRFGIAPSVRWLHESESEGPVPRFDFRKGRLPNPAEAVKGMFVSNKPPADAPKDEKRNVYIVDREEEESGGQVQPQGVADAGNGAGAGAGAGADAGAGAGGDGYDSDD